MSQNYIPNPKPHEVAKEQSTSEFIKNLADEIQAWLRNNTLNKVDKGMRWQLLATMADGTIIVIDRLSAHGHALVKVEGELKDGRPALVVSHLHSVQFLATYIRTEGMQPRPKREIGFHTGLGPAIVVSQDG